MTAVLETSFALPAYGCSGCLWPLARLVAVAESVYSPSDDSYLSAALRSLRGRKLRAILARASARRTCNVPASRSTSSQRSPSSSPCRSPQWTASTYRVPKRSPRAASSSLGSWSVDKIVLLPSVTSVDPRPPRRCEARALSIALALKLGARRREGIALCGARAQPLVWNGRNLISNIRNEADSWV